VNCEDLAELRFVCALCGDFALNFVGNLAYKAGMRLIVTNMTKCEFVMFWHNCALCGDFALNFVGNLGTKIEYADL